MPVVLLLAQSTPETSTGTSPSSTPSAEEEIVKLSPFIVNASNTGYYASNTLSGTRLNSDIADLGASVSIITKQQMRDFALLDINDIFNYQVSTEGTGNYTNATVNAQGIPTDAASLNPQSANRIRGLGAATIFLGGFETSGRVPIDPLNIDALEVNRGPNSSVFGIGGVAGSVNAVPSSANLSRNKAQVTARYDSVDGYRTTLDVNQILKQDVLAIRASMAVQHDGFERRPSGVDSKRINGMISYHPFKSTLITASYTHYNAYGNRPNSLTPYDYITPWIKNGRPTWDPTTGQRKVGGVVVGTGAGTLFQTSGETWGAGPMPIMSTDPYGSPSLAVPYYTSSNTPNQNVAGVTFTTASSSVTMLNSLMVPITDQTYVNQSLIGTIYERGVSSKAIYDYSSINTASPNYFNEADDLSTVLLEQNVFKTQRQSLDFQLGWFGEHNDKLAHSVVGAPGANGATNALLTIDVNEKNLNGTPNPNFLRPYLFAWVGSPWVSSPAFLNTYRPQIAYKLNLRQARGFARWLGLQRLSGYYEYKKMRSETIQYVPRITSGPASWMPTGVALGYDGAAYGGLAAAGGSVVRLLGEQMYVGDATGNNVDYAPVYYDMGPYKLTYGNPTNGFKSDNVTVAPVVFSADAGYLTLRKDRGVTLQSFFLKDRLVTTFGARMDEQDTRGTKTAVLMPDGINLDDRTFGQLLPGNWTKLWGRTRTAGAVFRPLSWLGLYANRSDSFQPSAPGMDLFLKPLGEPRGRGEDWGFSLSLFRDKLIVRVNQYRNLQINTPNGSSASFTQRPRILDFTIYAYGLGPATSWNWPLQTLATGWVTSAAAAQGQTLTQDQINSQVAAIMQLPVQYMAPPDKNITNTDSMLGKGREIELSYNPSVFWTMQLNVAQQEVINASISPAVFQWIDQRLPVWESIVDPTTGKLWWTSVYPGSTATPQAYYTAQLGAPLQLLKATEGLSQPSIRKYRVNYIMNYRLAGITGNRILKNVSVSGALRWEDKGGIGYYGTPAFPAVMTAYDPSLPIYDKAHYYTDVGVSYRTKVWGGKVGTTFQFNVRNIFENGGLQPAAAYPDGTTRIFRIIDPRLFIFSVTFDL